MNREDQFLWVEKYRPSSIQDCILPEHLKRTFKDFVDNKEVPNLLLSGTGGVGKTTVARALLEELGCDYIIINGSLNGDLDTLRTDIQNYASTMSLVGGRKYVILDEADYLNWRTQPALRNFMEEFSKTCGFILTCNYKNKIIEPLHSRCAVIEFNISKKDYPKLASLFFKRVTNILENEKIEFDKATVAEVVKKFYPDCRRVLNELQRYASSGKIDSGILSNFQSISIKELIRLMKEKNYTEVRGWVTSNIDVDTTSLFRSFYDNCQDYIKPNSIPLLIILIAKYQYQQSFVADVEINMLAFLAECIIELDFV